MPTHRELALEYAQRDISLQYSQLCQPSNCPSGIYVQLDDDDTHIWHAVMFVHSGPFRGGIFRFDIVFPSTYPLSTPQVFFPPTLLHPLVDPNSGRLSLASKFVGAWRPRQDFVSHVLEFVKTVFEEETLERLREGNVVNIEVYRMFRSHRTLFNKLALQSVALSTSPSSLYDTSGGSGFPTPSIGGRTKNSNFGEQKQLPKATIEEANGMVFRDLSQQEMDVLRREIFGTEEENEEEKQRQQL